MSKLFYDHLILLDDVFTEIEILEVESEDKIQMKKIVDEILHHRVLTRILDLLPKVHHEEFLDRFYKAPSDVRHLKFLQEKIDRDIHHELAKLSKELKSEIRQEIKKHKKIK